MKKFTLTAIMIAFCFNLAACQKEATQEVAQPIQAPQQPTPPTQSQRDAATPHFESAPLPPEKNYKNPKF